MLHIIDYICRFNYMFSQGWAGALAWAFVHGHWTGSWLGCSCNCGVARTAAMPVPMPRPMPMAMRMPVP